MEPNLPDPVQHLVVQGEVSLRGTQRIAFAEPQVAKLGLAAGSEAHFKVTRTEALQRTDRCDSGAESEFLQETRGTGRARDNWRGPAIRTQTLCVGNRDLAVAIGLNIEFECANADPPQVEALPGAVGPSSRIRRWVRDDEGHRRIIETVTKKRVAVDAAPHCLGHKRRPDRELHG